MRIEHSIEIDQPPSVVYDFMMDPENLPLWLTNFVRMEYISGEPGEPGAVSRHIYDEKGRQIEMIETIVSIIENKEMTASYTSDHFDMMIYNYLQPSGEKSTKLTIVNEVEMKGFFMKLFSRFFKGHSDKRLQDDLEKLKDAIEELTEIEGD